MSKLQISLYATIIVIFSGTISLFILKAPRMLEPRRELYINNASSLFNDSNFEEGLFSLKKAEFIKKDDKTNLLHGMYSFQREDYASAIQYLDNLSSKDAIYWSGTSYLKLFRVDKAAPKFEKLIKIEDNESHRENLLQAYLLDGKLDKAVNFSIESNKIYKNNSLFARVMNFFTLSSVNIQKQANFYLENANWLLQNNYYKAAINMSNKALILFPQYRDAYLIKGDAELSSDNNDFSIKSFNKAIEIDPAYYFSYLKLAEALQKSGDIQGKEDALEKARIFGYQD
ncbi:hypothetical protein AUK11_03545 [bacterium CG2_30_37_16]|nr:MAG: hypothetical protein AUK11_03545 [bacterium CG2_30_37_16]PIP30860.1 MAG: hypothetical protein COX25_02485 [bacterium (Candidatus Howlettbacteria) CG23_combo_of_CG06-09_8_20_14_all_37_9]